MTTQHTAGHFPPAPIDPLDIFSAIDRIISDTSAPSDLCETGPYYVSPRIVAHSDVVPSFCQFASFVNAGACVESHLAAIYVAARLFGERWRSYAPPVQNKRLIDSVDARVRELSSPDPRELVQILRVFRVFGDRQSGAEDLGSLVKQVGRFAPETFNATTRSDVERVAAFILVCQASPKLTETTRGNFVEFVGRNSFVRQRDIRTLEDLMWQRKSDDETDRTARRQWKKFSGK